MDHSNYLETLYTPKFFEATVQNTTDVVLKLRKKVKFDAIAVRGISGMGIGFPVSYMTDIPLICVRKSTSTNHGQLVEGPAKKIQKYIILDDFIDTGKSIKTIVRNINRDHYSHYGCDISICKPVCCGIVLYSDIVHADDEKSFRLKENHHIPITCVKV